MKCGTKLNERKIRISARPTVESGTMEAKHGVMVMVTQVGARVDPTVRLDVMVKLEMVLVRMVVVVKQDAVDMAPLVDVIA